MNKQLCLGILLVLASLIILVVFIVSMMVELDCTNNIIDCSTVIVSELFLKYGLLISVFSIFLLVGLTLVISGYYSTRGLKVKESEESEEKLNDKTNESSNDKTKDISDSSSKE